MKAPKISIVIAAHNEGEYLSRTVESILAHTRYPDYELVLIDDGSRDISFNFLEDRPRAVQRGPTDLPASYTLQGRTPIRVCVDRFETSAGCIRARHQGVGLSKGRWILFLDAHMAVQDGWLTALARALLRWGTKAAITPGVTTLDVASWAPGGPTWQAMLLTASLDFAWGPPEYPSGMVSTAGGCCVLMTRELYNAAGGFDLGLCRWGCEFIDLIMKVYAAGGACIFEPRIQVGHLFRKAHTFPMQYQDLNYNKLRTAYRHFPEAGFSTLRERLADEPEFELAASRFEADAARLFGDRERQRISNQRDPYWYLRTFLPELL